MANGTESGDPKAVFADIFRRHGGAEIGQCHFGWGFCGGPITEDPLASRIKEHG